MTARTFPDAMREAYMAVDRVLYDGTRNRSDALWRGIADELAATGWECRRIAARCALCGEWNLLADASAVLLDDGTPAEMCHECEKAAR